MVDFRLVRWPAVKVEQAGHTGRTLRNGTVERREEGEGGDGKIAAADAEWGRAVAATSEGTEVNTLHCITAEGVFDESILLHVEHSPSAINGCLVQHSVLSVLNWESRQLSRY